VLVRTDDGLVGWGEASHSGDDAACRLAIDGLAKRALGRSPFEIEAIVQPLAACTRGFVPATAASGLEHALWDVVGKAAGQPVRNLLGGPVRDRVRLYANVNRHVVRREPESYGEAAAAAVAEGFTAVKCAPFDDVHWSRLGDAAGRAALEAGLARVRAIRRAVGAEIDLLVDCHWRFDVPTALRVAEELAAERLYWLEDPVGQDDPEQLREVKARLGTRLAGGERLLGRSGFRELIERRAVDVVMPDLKHVGGILETKKIAAMAEVHGVAVAPHSPAGPIASAAGAQLCATLPNFLILEHAWGEVDWRADLVGGERIEGGAYVFSDRPGLGIEVDERLLATWTNRGTS
jgi:galactonate dehydratase